MENKNIIIILVVIIVILAAAIGLTMFNPIHAKQPTKINITSKNTLTEGDDLSLQLTDLNKTAISNQKVNITVKDSKGKVVLNKTVKTNSKGNAKLDLDLKKGKYNVTVSYSGNENYTGNNTIQNLTIKEKVVKAQQTSSSSNSESSGWTDSKGTYHFIRYDVKQKEIGDGEIRYRFEISRDEWGNYNADLNKDIYEYDYESESYVFWYSEGIDGVGLGKDDAICTYEGYDNNSTKEEVLSKNVTITYFNYRRLSDTQIAASNKFASYILKEKTNQNTPELEAYDLNGNHLISFVLISL